jgi:hypothetical protein
LFEIIVVRRCLLKEEEKQRDFYNLLEACAAGDLANVKTILG